MYEGIEAFEVCGIKRFLRILFEDPSLGDGIRWIQVDQIARPDIGCYYLLKVAGTNGSTPQ
jgi:hypothetical protein